MKLLFILIIGLTLTACDIDEDGVPKITDPNNIIVDGQQIMAEAFYNAYCKLKPTHETCIAVKRVTEVEAALLETRRGTVPRF